ncbi:MAG: DUF1559 domain-containing protein [Planctomycetaceae bacterium]
MRVACERGGTRGANCYKAVAGSNTRPWGDPQSDIVRRRILAGNTNGLISGNGFICHASGRNRVHVTNSSLKDGTSNTIVVGEAIPGLCTHTSWGFFNHTTGTCAIPPNYYLPEGKYGAGDWGRNYSFASWHPGGVQFALMDGKITFVSENIDINTYRALATIRGNESAAVP